MVNPDYEYYMYLSSCGASLAWYGDALVVVTLASPTNHSVITGYHMYK